MTLVDTRDFAEIKADGWTLRSIHLPYQQARLSGCENDHFYFYWKMKDPIEYRDHNIYRIEKVNKETLTRESIDTVSDKYYEAACGCFDVVAFEHYETYWGGARKKIRIKEGKKFFHWTRYAYDPLDDQLHVENDGFNYGESPHVVDETPDNVKVTNIKVHQIHEHTFPEEVKGFTKQFFMWKNELHYLTSIRRADYHDKSLKGNDDDILSLGVYRASGTVNQQLSFLIGSTNIVSHPNYISYIQYNRLHVAIEDS